MDTNSAASKLIEEKALSNELLEKLLNQRDIHSHLFPVIFSAYSQFRRDLFLEWINY